MTREELLEKIDHELRGMDAESWHNGARALRAVMELHKPDEYYPEFCGVCWWEEHERETYPCQTIQVLEKELQYD